MADEAKRRLVNINQACELVGVTRRCIYTWLSLGKVEHARTAGGRTRIYADTLMQHGPPQTYPVWKGRP